MISRRGSDCAALDRLMPVTQSPVKVLLIIYVTAKQIIVYWTGMWRIVIAILAASLLHAQTTHSGSQWTIRGHNTQVHVNQANFVLSVDSGPATWTMLPSSSNDLTVASGGDVLHFKLTD